MGMWWWVKQFCSFCTIFSFGVTGRAPAEFVECTSSGARCLVVSADAAMAAASSSSSKAPRMGGITTSTLSCEFIEKKTAGAYLFCPFSGAFKPRDSFSPEQLREPAASRFSLAWSAKPRDRAELIAGSKWNPSPTLAAFADVIAAVQSEAVASSAQVFHLSAACREDLSKARAARVTSNSRSQRADRRRQTDGLVTVEQLQGVDNAEAVEPIAEQRTAEEHNDHAPVGVDDSLAGAQVAETVAAATAAAIETTEQRRARLAAVEAAWRQAKNTIRQVQLSLIKADEAGSLSELRFPRRTSPPVARGQTSPLAYVLSQRVVPLSPNVRAAMITAVETLATLTVAKMAASTLSSRLKASSSHSHFHPAQHAHSCIGGTTGSLRVTRAT